MRNRVNDIYNDLCVPMPKPHFYVVDQEKGESVESKKPAGESSDIFVYFVT